MTRNNWHYSHCCSRHCCSRPIPGYRSTGC